jgi:hypothetical protein
VPARCLRGVALAPLALCLLAAPAPASQARAHRAGQHRSVRQSRALWATIDICGPADQPNTVGVRGSMPGDGHARHTMYMRFQLQYLEADGKTWADLHSGSSKYVALGSAKIARQAGWSVQLMPSSESTAPSYTLRGLVTFQWRLGKTVLHEATRTTRAGRLSLADADPPGYSAARCTIG